MGQVKNERRPTLALSQPAAVASAQPIELKNMKQVARWVLVTPYLATRWIDECNIDNRNIQWDYVNRMATDMKEGRWSANGETIKFDEAGRLTDGQHRCWACILSETAFEVLLVEKVPADSYITTDIGRGKSLADHERSREKNGALLEALLRLIFRGERGQLGAFKDGKYAPTIPQLQEVLASHPQARDSAAWAANHSDVRRILVTSYAAILHYAGTTEGKPATVENFLERLGDGENLPGDSPIFQTRKELLKERAPRPGGRRSAKAYILGIAIKGWNLSKEGRKCKQLRADEVFPTLAPFPSGPQTDRK